MPGSFGLEKEVGCRLLIPISQSCIAFSTIAFIQAAVEMEESSLEPDIDNLSVVSEQVAKNKIIAFFIETN